MKKVLVVGTDNACRSQMMAALIRNITFDRVEVQSAGIAPKKINATVIKILHEIGVDISHEKSKSINEFINTKFDIIITTSEDARARVNSFLGNTTKIHKEFEDPRDFRGSASDREIEFREVREEMNEWLNEFVARHRLV